MTERTPFLDGGLRWIYDGDAPQRCAECGFEWSTTRDDALALVAAAPPQYSELLAGRDGMAPAPDGGWNATAYLWHLTDLARSWSERWAQLLVHPGSTLVGFDPDVLADARGYRQLPTAAALWALPEATEAFVAISGRLSGDVPFDHGDWGPGTVTDGTRWLAHELVHHRLDVDARAR